MNLQHRCSATRSPVIELEHRYRCHQAPRLLFEALGGGSRLFDKRCVLLRNLVHLTDGLGHLLDAGTLLAASLRNFGDEARQPMEVSQHLVHCLAGLPDQAGAILGRYDKVNLVPFGEFLVPRLQDFTAAVVVLGLKLVGIPVFVDGVFITIPSGNFCPELNRAGSMPVTGTTLTVYSGPKDALTSAILEMSAWVSEDVVQPANSPAPSSTTA